MHRDDEGQPRAARDPAQDGVAGRHRVVGMDEIDPLLVVELVELPGNRTGRPPAPAAVAPRGEAARENATYRTGMPSIVVGRARRRGSTTVRAPVPSGPGCGRARTSLSDGSGRSSATTRTSTPSARTARACRCAQMPQAGSLGRG